MKKWLTALVLIFFAAVSFAELPFALTLTTDLAYHPENGYTAGDTHFSAPTGPYRIVKPRAKIGLAYELPVLTSDSPLFSGNHVTFGADFAITPVSAISSLSVVFSPAAFLELSAGGMAGTGWNIASWNGIREYNTARHTYESLSSFGAWYWYGYANATLMFDAAVLWPGDWHHIVGLATYEVGYQHLAGTSQTIWEWQTSAGYADGWTYYQYYVLGYQMPLVLSMVGVSVTLQGHYHAGDYGVFADGFDGGFMSAEIAPLAQLTWDEKNEFYVMLVFSGRRSFAEHHDDADEEPFLHTVGREWIFDYIGFRWKHRF